MKTIRKIKIKSFSSLEAENCAEYARLGAMAPDERLAEFSVIQERVWGKKWTSKPIEKVATWEKVKW